MPKFPLPLPLLTPATQASLSSLLFFNMKCIFFFEFAAMELFKIYFSLLALKVSMIVYADDFATARQKINEAKPNINYDTRNLERTKLLAASKMFQQLFFWFAKHLKLKK